MKHAVEVKVISFKSHKAAKKFREKVEDFLLEEIQGTSLVVVTNIKEHE